MTPRAAGDDFMSPEMGNVEGMNDANRLVEAARKLSETLTPGDLEHVLHRITKAAVEVLPYVDLASITVQGVARRVVLPSVAVDVPEGQNLYLLVSPTSDTFVGMGSRVPGAVLMDGTTVHLPVVR